MNVITWVISIVLMAALSPISVSAAGTDIDIAAWLHDLGSEHSEKRETATRELSKLQVSHLPVVMEHAKTVQLAEVEIRLVQIVTQIVDRADADEIEFAINVIQKTTSNSSRRMERLAAKLDARFGNIDTLASIDKFQELLKLAQEKLGDGEPHPDIVESEFIENLLQTPGFQLVQGGSFSPEADPNKKSSGPDARQHILLYRVKWYRGGWSRWFIPGINDSDTKEKDELMWRYFSDHEFEYIELTALYGPCSRRETFITSLKNK